MATIFTDTFTDTPGTLLENHVSDSGGTWTEHPLYIGRAAISDAGRVRADSTAAQITYTDAVPASAEYDVQADIHVFTTTGAEIGLAGRADPTSDTLYYTRYQVGSWRLARAVNGTHTTLGTFTQAPTPGQDYAHKLEIRDAAKKLYIDGVERISVADNTVTAVGRAGVRTQSTAANDTKYHADNFIVTDLSGGEVTYVDGAGTLSATGTLTAAGEVVIPTPVIVEGASAPSATAGLTASGTAIADGASTPSGTGNLSASADVLSDGSASLVASPNLTGSGTPIADGSAQLTATPILSASGLVIVPDADVVEGSASLSAIASLTASGVEIPVGSATLTATPELAATGLVVVYGSASPSGVATITASGTLVIFGASTLTALGSIAASGAVYDPDSIVTEFKLRRGLQVGMRAGTP